MEYLEKLENLKNLIQSHCGMMITDVHSQQLEKFISEEIARTGKSISELYDIFSASNDEMIRLINAVVVNETYFFREEKQFLFLQKYLSENYCGKDIVIWSAACSSGEEPYSLASLALSCNTKPFVYATDIDTDALIQLKNGVYGSNSFRNDGSSFKPVLTKYATTFENSLGQTLYSIKPELKEKIICSRTNLLDMDASYGVPKNDSVDIIFIRNVFIYFSKETRDLILKKLSEKLKNGGLLFFSISEIAGVNPPKDTIPLVKTSSDSVYYFVKNKNNNLNNSINSVESVSANLQNAAIQSDFSGINQLNNSEKEKSLKREKYLQDLKNEALLQKKNLKSSDSLSDISSKQVSESVSIKSSVQTQQASEAKVQKSSAELWQELTDLVDKKNYQKAQELLETNNFSVNQLHLHYYGMGFIHLAQKNNEKAMEYFEKAGISNPRFWPAFFQVAMLLQNKFSTNDKRKRYEALVKTATLLEDKTQNQQYNYLMGAFSTNYFYQLCNDYLKKEFS